MKSYRNNFLGISRTMIFRIYFRYISMLMLVRVISMTSVLDYKFTRVSTAEYLIRMNVMENIQSSVQCGSRCAQTRLDDGRQRKCEAYSYSTSSRQCQMYAADRDGTDASGIIVYKYWAVDHDVDDDFHHVTAWGQTFIYYVSTDMMTFQQAREHCHALGAYLINFDSSDEYDTFKTFITGSGSGVVWVGASDLEKEGDWVSDRHKARLDPSIWTFKSGEPNNSGGNEHCGVYLPHHYLLNDVPCSRTYRAVCEQTP